MIYLFNGEPCLGLGHDQLYANISKSYDGDVTRTFNIGGTVLPKIKSNNVDLLITGGNAMCSIDNIDGELVITPGSSTFDYLILSDESDSWLPDDDPYTCLYSQNNDNIRRLYYDFGTNYGGTRYNVYIYRIPTLQYCVFGVRTSLQYPLRWIIHSPKSSFITIEDSNIDYLILNYLKIPVDDPLSPDSNPFCLQNVEPFDNLKQQIAYGQIYYASKYANFVDNPDNKNDVESLMLDNNDDIKSSKLSIFHQFLNGNLKKYRL